MWSHNLSKYTFSLSVQCIKLDLLFQQKHDQQKEGTEISQSKTKNETKQRKNSTQFYKRLMRQVRPILQY